MWKARELTQHQILKFQVHLKETDFIDLAKTWKTQNQKQN